MTTFYGRPSTNEAEMLMYLEMLEEKITARLNKHGTGLHISSAETYGIVAEEFHELMGAMHSNDPQEFVSELQDIAIAAIFGMVSASKRLTIKATH